LGDVQAQSVLTAEELEQFRTDGYLVRPAFLADEQIAAACAEVDRFVEAEPGFDGRNVAAYPGLCALITDPATLAVVDELMGGDAFTLHHCHAARHREGLPGVGWHHDYEQIPQTNRSHLQVHVLHYLGGLDGTIGDLLLLAGSHRAVMRRDALYGMGTETLPGAVVVNDLPPGSVVFAHSALVHARRPQPGGGDSSRYFIDIAFVQEGITWPSYGRPDWRLMLQRLDDLHRVDDRPRLFDADAFFDIGDAVARMRGAQGSVAMLLPEPDPSVTRPTDGAIPIVQ
jgi:hypothetical protein